MSTADAARSRFGLELPEKHPEAEDDGGPDAQRQREDADKSGARTAPSGRDSMQSAMLLLIVGLEACWVGLLIYVAYRLLA